MQRVLLLGCGNTRQRIVRLPGEAEDYSDVELVTVDMDPNCGADVVWDLDVRPLPFEDEEFDGIDTWDVLEHLGRQGDWRGYFSEFTEYWRILKPGGVMRILVPIGAEALCDPGHTRFFSFNHFHMLSQQWYADSLKAGKRVTDYRWCWHRDFTVLAKHQDGDHHIGAVLQKHGA